MNVPLLVDRPVRPEPGVSVDKPVAIVTVSSSSLPFPKSTRVSFAAGFGVINW